MFSLAHPYRQREFWPSVMMRIFSDLPAPLSQYKCDMSTHYKRGGNNLYKSRKRKESIFYSCICPLPTKEIRQDTIIGSERKTRLNDRLADPQPQLFRSASEYWRGTRFCNKNGGFGMSEKKNIKKREKRGEEKKNDELRK